MKIERVCCFRIDRGAGRRNDVGDGGFRVEGVPALLGCLSVFGFFMLD